MKHTGRSLLYDHKVTYHFAICFVQWACVSAAGYLHLLVRCLERWWLCICAGGRKAILVEQIWIWGKHTREQKRAQAQEDCPVKPVACPGCLDSVGMPLLLVILDVNC
jgi:hypothetical protein